MFKLCLASFDESTVGYITYMEKNFRTDKLYSYPHVGIYKNV